MVWFTEVSIVLIWVILRIESSYTKNFESYTALKLTVMSFGSMILGKSNDHISSVLFLHYVTVTV